MSHSFVPAVLFCMAFLVVAIPAAAELRTIGQGADVFIGESGLDISGAVAGYTMIAQWPSYAWPESISPEKVIDVTAVNRNFYINSADFGSRTGNWYCYRPGNTLAGSPVAFFVSDPSISLRAWNRRTDAEITYSAVIGEPLTFRVNTNTYPALNPSARPNLTPADGSITIRVKDPDKITLTSLVRTDGTTGTLENLPVDSMDWYWGGETAAWDTGAVDMEGQPVYKPGIYTIVAENNLNGMKDNYRNAGAEYTGKTVSWSRSVFLESERLSIESNRVSVLKGDRFSVTVHGRPATRYYLRVKGTGAMTGDPHDQPPTVSPSAYVTQDPAEGPFTIGSYAFTGGDGKTILDDVPPSTPSVSKTRYYAVVTTSRTSGVASAEIRTTGDTKPGTYTFIAENGSFSDTVSVLVVGPGPLPGCTLPPTDPDGDRVYEDLNGNGRKDFADVVLFFDQMTWISANEPVFLFDFNGNYRIDFADIVALFSEV